jgi:hypothetical protein
MLVVYLGQTNAGQASVVSRTMAGSSTNYRRRISHLLSFIPLAYEVSIKSDVIKRKDEIYILQKNLQNKMLTFYKTVSWLCAICD